MNILKKIYNSKKESVLIDKRLRSEKKLQNLIDKISKPKGFRKCLNNTIQKGHPALIAEIKKGSPSKGIIRDNYIPKEIADSYFKAGASCISVLTDKEFFYGSKQDLLDVVKTVSIPVLRKDFIISEYQIIETRAMGCDCLLLIVSLLSKEEIRNFYGLARSLGMDVLIEIHNEKELDIALELGPNLIGINNRNLKTFATSLNNSIKLLKNIPDEYEVISESGISSVNDIKLFLVSGIKRFLIGEFFMKQNNIFKAVKEVSSIDINH